MYTVYIFHIALYFLFLLKFFSSCFIYSCVCCCVIYLLKISAEWDGYNNRDDNLLTCDQECQVIHNCWIQPPQTLSSRWTGPAWNKYSDKLQKSFPDNNQKFPNTYWDPEQGQSLAVTNSPMHMHRFAVWSSHSGHYFKFKLLHIHLASKLDPRRKRAQRVLSVNGCLRMLADMYTVILLPRPMANGMKLCKPTTTATNRTG